MLQREVAPTGESSSLIHVGVLVTHLSRGVMTAGVRAASRFGTADTEKASCSEKLK